MDKANNAAALGMSQAGDSNNPTPAFFWVSMNEGDNVRHWSTKSRRFLNAVYITNLPMNHAETRHARGVDFITSMVKKVTVPREISKGGDGKVIQYVREQYHFPNNTKVKDWNGGY